MIHALGTNGQRTDLDSHADTCVVSENTALIIRDYETPVVVSGYKDSLGKETCRTVTGVVAYDHLDGRTYYLHLNQALDVPDIKGNLLCPMQLRECGVRVNDEPKHMVLNPTVHHHAVTIPSNGIHPELIIPLSLKGVIHYIPTRKPSVEEYQDAQDDQIIQCTESEVPWDPQRTAYCQAEEEMIDSEGRLREKTPPSVFSRIISLIRRAEDFIRPDDELLESLKEHRMVASIDT